MHNLSATAVRINGAIEVTVLGSLPNSCYTARIKDHYPGGQRVYVVDPGEAQVFVEESVKPGSVFCLFILVPWAGTVKFHDPEHDTVGIYVNEEKVLEVKVVEQEDEFIVIALVDTEEPNYKACSIVPKGSMYPAIYKEVFGPGTMDECKKFISSNCSEIE